MDWDAEYRRMAFLTHHRDCHCDWCAMNATANDCSSTKSVENRGIVSGQPTESGEFRDTKAP